MDYNKIKSLCSLKNIAVRKLADRIEMTETGLYSAFRNNTLKIRDLESIADVLDVPVSYFFGEMPEDGKKIVQSGENNLVGSNQNIINSNAAKELDECRKEVAYLKEQVKDKEKLIKLLESK